MLQAKQLIKSFKSGDTEVVILKGIDFTVQSGEFVAIMGRSGAGKSTLLYQMSLLDHPTSGQILVDGKDANQMASAERVKFRLTEFGYVFQDYALLPELTALENVALPLLMQNFPKKRAYAEAEKALTKVGVERRMHNLPSQLSGGEQQRVSIARAVGNNPKVLFADEPTANLDNESSSAVIKIFEELHNAGQTIIMVTHEEQYALRAEKIITIDDGRIVGEKKNR
jgi:putative ABC transport system ATP-binding protein